MNFTGMLPFILYGTAALVYLAGEIYVHRRTYKRVKSPFIVGQVWNYRTRKNEPFSSLTIVKIEKIGKDIIIHINIKGLRIEPGNESDGWVYEVSHIPITAKALEASVTSVACEADVLPDYERGYNEWKLIKETPVYDVPVKKIIEGMEAAMRAGVDFGIEKSDENDD